MKLWICSKCGHEVYAKEKPQPIKWTDGHVCYFHNPADEFEKKIKEKKQYNVYYQKGPRKGQPKTLTDRVIRFLTEGMKKKELPSKNRYRKFTGSGPGSFYWIGKNGAMRAGPNASNSVSLTDKAHANMKLWERENGLS